jgi:hypothetical protein
LLDSIAAACSISTGKARSTASSAGTIQAGSSCQDATKASVCFRSVSLGKPIAVGAVGQAVGAHCVGTAGWIMAVVSLVIEEPAAPGSAVISVPVALGLAGGDEPLGMAQ